MCANHSSRTARHAPQFFSRECMRLPIPNLIHNHPEVAIKNWALRLTDGGHHRRHNRRMTVQNRWIALLAIRVALHGPRTGSQLEIGPVTKV